jgi:uncharacterized protein (TIGR03435 family)
MHGGPGTPDPAQIVCTSVTLMSVLLRADDVKPFQATSPAGLTSDRYDIAARVPPDTTKAQFKRMLQALLADRFHLVLHHMKPGNSRATN